MVYIDVSPAKDIWFGEHVMDMLHQDCRENDERAMMMSQEGRGKTWSYGRILRRDLHVPAA